MLVFALLKLDYLLTGKFSSEIFNSVAFMCTVGTAFSFGFR